MGNIFFTVDPSDDKAYENLPTMEEMGIEEKIKRSLPYHPGIDILRVHYEQTYRYYQYWALEKRALDYDKARRRWWRVKFRQWYRQEMRNSRAYMRPLIGPEPVFFQQNPQLRDSWEAYKVKVNQTVRKRLGAKGDALDIRLRHNWMARKKFEYMMREIGLREEPYWRHYTRTRSIKKYLKGMICCTHAECWRIRWRSLWKIPFWVIAFELYYHFHKETLDIH